MVTSRVGKVYIIGAGCGNIDLLTLKAKRCIEEADCILYDRLIDLRVLKLAKPSAEKIYIGKGNTEGGTIQEKINKTLVEKALAGKVVARVKGGDPFVFGRGGEEIEKIVKYGIPFEIIPGISSSIAVPEYAGIPVTHRGVAKSFHIFTGHLMENGEWHDFSHIAKLTGTLIFLMGIKNLELITNDLMKNGKNQNTPVAIIEKGTSAYQRVTVGTLKDIVVIAKTRKVVPPAIIVIGEVVNLRNQFKWVENLPLFGKKIMITRDEEHTDSFEQQLRIKGADTVNLPFIKIVNSIDFDDNEMKKYSAVLFNSPNGVRTFMNNLKDIRCLGAVKIGVVGEKTKEILESYKIIPDFIPEKYMGEELAKEVINHTKPKDKILFVTSNISPANCKKWSVEYKREFTRLTAYRTEKILYKKEIVENRLKNIDYLTFLSSSTVEAFDMSIDNDLELVKNKKIVSIGPVTTKTLNKLGYTVHLEAKKYSVDGVISIIEEENNDK